MREQECECSMFVRCANIPAWSGVFELQHSLSAAFMAVDCMVQPSKFVGNKFIVSTYVFVGEICEPLEPSGGSLAAPAFPIPSLTPPRRCDAAPPHSASRVRSCRCLLPVPVESRPRNPNVSEASQFYFVSLFHCFEFVSVRDRHGGDGGDDDHSWSGRGDNRGVER